MFTKAKIYNLALSALLLQRQIANPDTDASNEAKVLNTNFDTAFRATLEDLDLDSMSTQKVLELIESEPTDFPEWRYVYKYPTNCANFRRIKSCATIDNRTTHIPRLVRMFEGQKAIFTNEAEAIAEIIPWDIPLTSLDAITGVCIAHRLAAMSAPLIVGKGADRLRKILDDRYVLYKSEAKEKDRNENQNFIDERTESEFVNARLE